MTSRSVVSMRMMALPVDFSIASIWDHVLLSWTKLIEIPLRPKRPVRPDKPRIPSIGIVCYYRERARTDAVDIRLNVWPRVSASPCSLAIIHEREVIVHHHIDL